MYHPVVLSMFVMDPEGTHQISSKSFHNFLSYADIVINDNNFDILLQILYPSQNLWILTKKKNNPESIEYSTQKGEQLTDLNFKMF